jgi:hypothetical protein
MAMPYRIFAELVLINIHKILVLPVCKQPPYFPAEAAVPLFYKQLLMHGLNFLFQLPATVRLYYSIGLLLPQYLIAQFRVNQHPGLKYQSCARILLPQQVHLYLLGFIP